MDHIPDFESWRAQALAQGYDEVLERRWAPNVANATHAHPFDVTAVLLQGEMWLEQGGMICHIVPGGGFELKANVAHSERYGSEGALFWSARRHVGESAA
jgi:hypothetical protein